MPLWPIYGPHPLISQPCSSNPILDSDLFLSATLTEQAPTLVTAPFQPYEALIHEGRFQRLCMPATLYHGTSSSCLSALLSEGLRPDIANKQSSLSSDFVYLITDVTMAAHLARSRAFRQNDEPLVLAVSSSHLDIEHLHFDLNLCGRYWTESIAYGKAVDPQAITVLPSAVTQLESRNMLLSDPLPGEKPLVFSMDWPCASLFQAYIYLHR